MEGQRRTQLGKGMKPRGSSSNASEPEEITQDVSNSDEGHTKIYEKMDVVDSSENDTSAESVAQADFSPPTLENPPDPEAPKETSPEAVVAVTDRFEHFMAPPADAEEKVGDFQNLADLMRKSKESKTQSVMDQILDPFNPGGLLVMPSPEEIEAIETGNRLPVEAAEESERLKRDAGMEFGVPQITAEQAWKIGSVHPATDQLGPQPNGDYGVLVMVPEQLVSGVLGQAELDGVSPSEWLSERVGEYLSQWFFGR